MGQKTNPRGFRLSWKKNWLNPSFYQRFNYNQNNNQDYNLIKYIKGFLQYFNIKNNLVLLRRLSGQIYVSIIFYNKNYLLKEVESIVKPRKLIFRVNKKNKLISPTQIGFQKFKKRNKNYGLYFKPFNIFETFRQDRSKQIYTYLKIINFFKLKNSRSLDLNSIWKLLWKKNQNNLLFNVSFFIQNKLFVNSSVSTLKIKLFLIYFNKLIHLFFFSLYGFGFVQKLRLSLLYYFNLIFSNPVSLKNGIKVNSLKSKLRVKNAMVIKNKEGISFKRLLALLVSKMTGIFNVKINLIQLDNPSRVMRRQFNILKRTTRARGRLKNEVYDIILVLYQSMILKYPQMLNNYLVPLIRYNIKNVRQIFLILSNLFPYFCKVLKFRGIKIELKGRINGSKRTQITKLQYGMVPLMGIADSLHYSYNKVMTIHGVYSLRVWYFI